MLRFFKFGKSEPVTPAVARKARSIALLKQHRVPFIEHLPYIEDESQAKQRSAQALFRRARARTVYFMRGQAAMAGASLAEFQERMNELDAWSDLTPEERVVVESAELTQQNVIDSSWAAESVAALAWVAGMTPNLTWPTGLCDPDAILHCIHATRSAESLKPRELSEVLDQTDLHYRLHWACRDAQLRGLAEPAGLSGSVIVERRRALEWAVSDREWDEIDLST